MNIVLNPPRFDSYIPPFGHLIDVPAVHALWYYYITTLDALKKQDEHVQYEDEPDFGLNHRERAKSIGVLYGIDPMSIFNQNNWVIIERQATAMGLDKLQGKARIVNVLIV